MKSKEFFSKVEEIMRNNFCDDSICNECVCCRAEKAFHDPLAYGNEPVVYWCDIESEQFGFPDGCSSFEQHERREDD